MPPLSYDLTEPPSLLQIDSKMSLGVQTMGLPHCSTAFSEPFVLDRCRVSLLFDATSKSHADRSQRSAGYLHSASSILYILFKRIFRAARGRFIDAAPLFCIWCNPQVFCRQIPEIYCVSTECVVHVVLKRFQSRLCEFSIRFQAFARWNRLPSSLFQVNARVLMVKQVPLFCSKTFSELLVWDRWFTSVSGEAVIFWTRVPKIHSMKIMKLIDCPPCGFDAAFLFLWNQVPKPIVWDKSSTCLSNNGSPMLSLFKLVGSAACLKSTAHFCVIWRRPQVSCRQPPFWKKQVPKLIPKSCVDRMPKSTPVASLLHVMFY